MMKTPNEIARETLTKKGLNHLPPRAQAAVASAVDAVLTALQWEARIVDESSPRGSAFFAAAERERSTHAGRGWSVEHDRERGVRHPLGLALDYLAHGLPVKAGSLIMAGLELLEPGNLTDELITRAVEAVLDADTIIPDGGDPRGDAERVVRAVLAAAGLAPARESGRCGGCRDLGPHRNVPGCDYYKPDPAPDVPSGADAMGTAIRDAEDRRSLAEAEANGWPIVRRNAPSADREKRLREHLHQRPRSVSEGHAMAASFRAGWDAALAVPPVVDAAPTPVTIAHAGKSGKTSALVDAVLAQANEHGIALTIVPPPAFADHIARARADALDEAANAYGLEHSEGGMFNPVSSWLRSRAAREQPAHMDQPKPQAEEAQDDQH